MRDPIGEAQRQARKAYERQQRTAYGNPAPETTHKKKKIDPEVGEYIAFTEIDVKETETNPKDGTSTSTTYHEQQVTDVEWEDL